MNQDFSGIFLYSFIVLIIIVLAVARSRSVLLIWSQGEKSHFCAMLLTCLLIFDLTRKLVNWQFRIPQQFPIITIYRNIVFDTTLHNTASAPALQEKEEGRPITWTEGFSSSVIINFFFYLQFRGPLLYIKKYLNYATMGDSQTWTPIIFCSVTIYFTIY